MSKHKKYKEKGKLEDRGKKQADFPIKLSMWYFDQCDPKRCSGMKLKQMGYLSTLSMKAKFPGIVLTPSAEKVVSIEDKELIEKSGVCVIDCSWKHFAEVKVKSIKKNERMLPFLLAANPMHYGKGVELNCAEALAAALVMGGLQEEGEEILNLFNWGPAFFSLNEIYFEKYLVCKNSEELQIAEKSLIEEIEQMRLENKQREQDFPYGSSSGEEGEEEEEKQGTSHQNAESNSSREETKEEEDEENGQEEEGNQQDDLQEQAKPVQEVIQKQGEAVIGQEQEPLEDPL